MIEFLNAVKEYEFLRNALLTGVLAGIGCGVVGTYVVARRISYIAGGISHCVLAGLGGAQYLNKVWGMEWLKPVYGAAASALLAAVIIGLVSLRARQREDTVIGALWAIGMAAGVLFISRTPGYSQDLMAYLFGNILMVTKQDLATVAVLDAVVVAVGAMMYHQLLAVCFDEEFARARGLNVELIYLLLLCLTALTIVLLISVVGIVMVIALLTLPAAVANFFSKTLWKIMVLSVGLSVFFTSAGMAVSYGPDFPAGATIILLAGLVYIVISFLKGPVTRRRHGTGPAVSREPRCDTPPGVL